MAKNKNTAAAKGQYDKSSLYGPADAVALARSMAFAKFDESVDIAFNLGIDARKADQLVRGTVSLPHGTGKEIRIVAFVSGADVAAAEEAGADIVGGKELAEEISAGRALDFDLAIAAPDMMSHVGKLGSILGPRGLMPNPKSGTVTKDVGKAIKEFKAGRVEYRNDRYGNVHIPIGKVSFEAEQLADNLAVIADEIIRNRPPAVKGRFVRKVTVSSTMGPGVNIDVSGLEDMVKELH
ncbi:MAG: 50S ribosomal protein L1 [Acidimicrobiia bacterium]|nr:50S ribosomal protein L1 [Acidimicrobiia bacterium]MDX2468009.1 50S ribosomal protein L1 [Acidimicrobiia bacterium]